jgi:four helix bundle protein
MIASTQRQSLLFFTPLAQQIALLKDDLLDPVDHLLDDDQLVDLASSDTLKHSAMNASGVMPSTRPAAQTFRDLLVWQKAHQFVLGVYQLTATFPRQETFGLALQMRRAAVSIAANIAEGFAKRSKAEKARFLNIAEGSLEESRYYLILTEDLGYSKTEELLKYWRKSAVFATATQAPFWLPAPEFWLPYP